ncbi:MAG TPA: FAD-linked oxidase C-terminal domain-containing protein [Bacillales bacterium]|nr:FAD-linked oxidase C-terminal domain-containing protein [Bacillales bacterium]
MKLAKELREILAPERVSENETIRRNHAKDESHHEPRLPDVVVFPETTEEIAELLAYASRNGVPIVPFGVGSSLEGHVIPIKGGISIDFERMNRILEVRSGDFLVKVQPGVTRTQLNQALKKHGLFFPVDPGADATIGGMAATNASGTTAVRYGVMRDQVRDLEVVLADGRIIHTGGLAAKSSSGYNLTHLFLGSEGTLGVFTEITLRVHGIPEATAAARAAFPSVKNAVDAALTMLASGIPLARVELVDARSIKQVNGHEGTAYSEKATLFLEFHGNEDGLKADVVLAQQCAEDERAESFEIESDSKKRAQLWLARHHLAYAFIHGYPDKKIMFTDVCVPLTELTGAVVHAREQLELAGLDGAVLGHIGDGNFHALIMYDPHDSRELEAAIQANEKIVDHALSRGGTCTGEHGVGIGKQKYQQKEHGESLEVMKALKKTLDPAGILNPGKVLPCDK